MLAVDDAVLTRFTDLRFISPFARQTPLGGLLAAGSIIFLICWPGRSESGSLASSDVAMRRLAIALTALIVGSSAVLLAPLNFFVPQRHALVQRAVASGWPSFAAALLTPLAELSDSRALNNLGVFRARGVGTPRNFDDASRLFARATDRGSTRARLNAAMIAPGSCGLNVSQAAAMAAALAPIAESDPAAASHIQDCLYFQATSTTLPDRDQRSLTAASQVQQTDDALSCCIPDRRCSIARGRHNGRFTAMLTASAAIARLSFRLRARRWNCFSRRRRLVSPVRMSL